MVSNYAQLERAHRRANHRSRLIDAIEGDYVPAGYDPSAWSMITKVACPYCKAPAGKFCHTRDWEVIAPSSSHSRRWKLYWRHYH